jgi:hypothetical protein
MTRVTLLHNDDETLDPADSSLRARGTLKIDGHERGTWETHRDGRWTALLDGASIEASSEDALISQIETRVA